MPEIALTRRHVLAAGALAFAAKPSFALAPKPLHDEGTGEPSRFHRFKVGSIECVALNDGTAMLGSVQPTFANGVPKESLDAALDRAFHPRDKAMLEFNAIALKLGSDWVLIDAGYGSAGAPAMGKIPANLRAAGIAPDAIKAVFISHAHGDHINGVLTKEGSLTFPNASYFMSKIEHDFWTGSPDLSKMGFPDQTKKEFIAGAQKHIAAMKGKLSLIDEKASVFPQLTFVPTPGHTPGHTSLLLRDGKDELFILADVAHNHVVMFANPAWGPIFDTDPAQATVTREKLWDRLATDRTKVMAFHLPWPGLGHVRRDGKSYEWLISPEGL